MNQTNSNSITSILICALNDTKSDFRTKMLTKFGEISQSKLDDIYFYDGTHSPLKIKEMKNKQVDIYARKFGEQKVRLMIEIKANLYEALQESQKKNSVYENAAKALECDLLYIVPKEYKHKNMLSQKIIEWETVLEIAKKSDKKLAQQIEHFVQAEPEEDNQSKLSRNELQLLDNPENLGKLYKEQRSKLKGIINNGDVGVNEKNFSISDYEFGYYFDNKNFFLGYSYILKNFDDFKGQYDFFLCITETKDNIILGKNGFYYNEGWYWIPIKPIENMDIKTLEDLKEMIKDLKGMRKKNSFFHCNLNLDEIQKFEINKNTKNVYPLIRKIKLLCECLNIEDFKITDFEINNEYFGYYFHEKKKRKDNNIFIGIDKTDGVEDNDGLSFVFELIKNDKLQIQKLNDLENYKDFVKAKTFDEQKTEFAKLIQVAKEKLEK